MMKFFKLLLLAIFLIIGLTSANELEVNSLENENNNVKVARSTPCRPRPTTTTRPTTRPPLPGGTTRPTNPPTNPPTDTPTNAPTPAPTTPAPTQRPTPAPTTPAPTQRATPAPTQRATPAPTQRPTPAPTQRPTPAPTQRPTSPPVIPTTPVVDLCKVTPLTQEPLKFLVPLYVYPSSGKWDMVAAAASKVATIGIVNPDNGPTSTPSGTYQQGVDKLYAANVELIGYVYTSYGDRPIADAKKDIDTWASKWPKITGIFFDEASSKKEDLAYYRELYNHVISKKGYTHVILNPGTQPDQGYMDSSTNIVIFETYGDKFTGNQAKFQPWVKCAPNAAQKAGYKYKFSGIGHSISGNSLSTALIRNMANAGMGMVYVTDGTPETSVYNPFPSYFNDQVSDIQALNKN